MQKARADEHGRGSPTGDNIVRRFRNWWSRPKPIGFFLALLIAATVLPALGISAVLLKRNDLAQREITTTLAAGMAASIAEAVDRELNGVITTLRIMATSPTLAENDLRRFHERATDALAGTGSHLILIDEENNLLLSTRVAYGTSLGKSANPDLVQAALSSRATIISDLFYASGPGQWVFNVMYPLHPDHSSGRVLAISQNADSMASTLSKHLLRGGWNASLLDREHKVIASTNADDAVGEPFFLALTAGRADEPARYTRNDAGDLYLTVVDESSYSGWKVVAWAPVAVIEAPVERTLALLFAGSLIVLVIGAGTALLVGRQITRPIRRLAADARRLGAGEPVSGSVYPIAEMTTVSQALAEAAKNRKQAENDIRLLMREVAHRAKNQLTVVSSMAKQTARHARSLPSFLDSFQKRIYGLARSTDLLIAGGAVGVELRELVSVQVEPFRPEDPKRLEISGPPFRLANQAAQTMGLAIHELATNAAKYGAFSTNGGKLHVSWKIENEALLFTWKESATRMRRRPAIRPGFGTEIIDRMLGGSFDAEIERNFLPGGLECVFRIPVSRIAPESVHALKAAAE